MRVDGTAGAEGEGLLGERAGVQLFGQPDQLVMVTTGLAPLVPELLCRSVSRPGDSYALTGDDLYSLILSTAERLRWGKAEVGVPFGQLWDRGQTAATVVIHPADPSWSAALGLTGAPRMEIVWSVGSAEHSFDPGKAAPLAALWVNEFPASGPPPGPDRVQPFGPTSALVQGVRGALRGVTAVGLGLTVVLSSISGGRLQQMFRDLAADATERAGALDQAWASALEDSRLFSGWPVGGVVLPPGAEHLVWPLAAAYGAWCLADLVPSAVFFSCFGPLEVAVAPAAAFGRLLAFSPRAAELFAWQSRLTLDEAERLGRATAKMRDGPTAPTAGMRRVEALWALVSTGRGSVAGTDVLRHLTPGPLDEVDRPIAEAAICLLADAMVAAALRDLEPQVGRDLAGLADRLDAGFRDLVAGT